MGIGRREFLAAGAMALAGAAAQAGAETAEPKRPAGKGRILFGACRPPSDAGLLKSVGYDFIEGNVSQLLVPDKDEEKWKRKRDEILSCGLPLRSCLSFIPGKMRLTGPNADWEPALEYAEIACRRADEVGTKTIVLGSGGARNVPAGFNAAGRKDWPKGFGPEEGRDQFAGFCAELAKRIAGCKVVVVIEPLRPNESNIVNYVWQGMQIVRETNHPRLRQLADIFHMMMGRESAQSIVDAGDCLKHCHIASWKTRHFPGSDPATVDRLAPYFDALKAIGYEGGVSCECGWGEKKDFAKNLETALKTMKGLV